MRSATRLMLCLALLAAVTFGVLAQPAHAGPIDEGALFGVFPQGGSFGGADQYTVVRFLEFGGSYPDSLQPVSWPSSGSGFDPGNPETPVSLGSEFFLIGNIAGVDPLDSHLLLSVQGADRGTPGELFTPFDDEGPMQALHDNLIAGTTQYALTTPDPARSITAADFWGNFEEGVEQQFFGLDLLQGGPFGGQQGAVVQLSAGTYEFDGGSEDLFGYTPFGQGDYSCLCDKAWYLDQLFLGWGIETSFYDLASHIFDCGPGNPFLTGALSGEINQLTEFDTRNGVTIPNPVPEPASLVLLGSSLIVGYGVRRRRRAA